MSLSNEDKRASGDGSPENNENDADRAMNVSDNSNKYKVHPKKTTIAFGFGAMTDQMSHQAFQFLAFTFFYAVVRIPADIIGLGFIIFAIWDSVNDPLLGPISDRTNTRFGRRGFWILISVVPFALINFFLFTPPVQSEAALELEQSRLINTIYMILIIMAYDLFYTMFSGNQTSLFPEMFKTEQIRSRANMYKNILTIVGVLIGFVLPTVLINPLAPEGDVGSDDLFPKYQMAGVVICIFVLIFGFIFYKFGVKEDPFELTKPKEMPGLLESLKMTLKNKPFLIFVTANLFIWFVFKLLTTIIPLYGQFVLDNGKGSMMTTILLLVAFLSATGFFAVQVKIGNKIGMREGLMLSCIVWIITLIPFYFFDGQGSNIPALICMFFMGFGLSGAMFYVDIIIGNIIDDAEVRQGKRREGSFYGINALINRYSTILVFVSISAVLQGYGWTEFLTEAQPEQIANLKDGLRLLLSIFSIAGLVIILILLKIFPLHGERLAEVKRKMQEKVGGGNPQ